MNVWWFWCVLDKKWQTLNSKLNAAGRAVDSKPRWFFFYRPQRSCGKVMFSQLSVILSTGGCLADNQPRGTYTHTPTHTADVYCSGRYASYWNAFLFTPSLASHKTKLIHSGTTWWTNLHPGSDGWKNRTKIRINWLGTSTEFKTQIPPFVSLVQRRRWIDFYLSRAGVTFSNTPLCDSNLFPYIGMHSVSLWDFA